jgi:hypothetical protein
MSSRNGIDLMAHLMRRAGFGASRSELEQLSATPYEAVFSLYPARIAAWVAFRSTRYSAMKLCCFAVRGLAVSSVAICVMALQGTGVPILPPGPRHHRAPGLRVG